MRISATAAIALLAIGAACDTASTDPFAASAPRLYVTSGATDQVLRLDARDGRIVGSFELDRRRDEVDEPHGIVIAPDRRHWYATVSHGDPTLWKFELPDDRLVGRVELGTYGAARIGVTPDGQRGFIPDYYRSGQGQESGLAVIDLLDLSIVDRPMVCAAPHDAQVRPGGQLVAIACSLSDEVVMMDVATLEVTKRFFVDAHPGASGSPSFKPLNLLWSPGGDTLYVTLHAAGEVRAFDLDGNVLGTVSVGAGPAQIAMTSDGTALVTANRADASMSIVDLPGLTERARIDLARPHPHGVALDDADSTAFITYEGTIDSNGGVVAVDLWEEEIVWTVEAGAFTLGIAYVSFR